MNVIQHTTLVPIHHYIGRLYAFSASINHADNTVYDV